MNGPIIFFCPKKLFVSKILFVVRGGISKKKQKKWEKFPRGVCQTKQKIPIFNLRILKIQWGGGSISQKCLNYNKTQSTSYRVHST